MAERKATNKYYPPDWDPSKGSANKRTNSHHLRHRAKKIDQGIIVVRFEMPFNIWCLKCDNHIAMGVRYNAEKSKIGNYYTTPIYKFKMKCHLCDNYFEIQTEPSKFDYSIISGARRQARNTEINDDANDIIDQEEAKKRLTDAMFRLEKKTEDAIKGEESLPTILDLKKWRGRWEDSFAANQLIRSQYRKKRKNIEADRKNDKEFLKRHSLRLPLVRPSPTDREKAKDMLDQRRTTRIANSETSKRLELLNSSIKTKQINLTRSPNSNRATKTITLHLDRIKREPDR